MFQVCLDAKLIGNSLIMASFVDRNIKVFGARDGVELLVEYEDIIQKTFSSENEGNDFFNKYARQKGFIVRKDNVKRHPETGMVVYRRFVCSRAGLRDKKHMNRTDRQRKERTLTRCECPVQFGIQFDPTTNRWFVHNFVDKHNHDLDDVAVRRSRRKIKDVQKSDTVLPEITGVRKHETVNVTGRENGGHENVGSALKDAKTSSPSDGRGGVSSSSEEMTRFCDLMNLGKKVFHEASKTKEDYQEIMLYLENKLKQKEKRGLCLEVLTQLESKLEGGIEKNALSTKLLDPFSVKTKATPKKRPKPSNEIRRYKCRFCRCFGHTIRRCPLSQKDAMQLTAIK